MTKIKSYIKPRTDKQLFQTFIDSALYKKIVAKLKKENISRRSFIEGSINQFLEENK